MGEHCNCGHEHHHHDDAKQFESMYEQALALYDFNINAREVQVRRPER